MGSSSAIAVQPARFAEPDVPDRVPGACGDDELLAWRGAMRLALDLELDVSLADHDELVDLMHVVGPDLARRIDPQPAREALFAPASRNVLLLHVTSVHLGLPSRDPSPWARSESCPLRDRVAISASISTAPVPRMCTTSTPCRTRVRVMRSRRWQRVGSSSAQRMQTRKRAMPSRRRSMPRW